MLDGVFSPNSFVHLNLQSSESNRRPEWYWRVTVAFGAWAERAIRLAKTRTDALDANLRTGYQLLREWFDCRGETAAVDAMADAGPVEIPGEAMIAALVTHARYGLCSKWAGWEKSAEKMADRERQEAGKREVERVERLGKERERQPKKSKHRERVARAGMF